ncbi:MAG: hypothetical protein II890_06230 [Spirochaetia bacterium]|nr:hypothetical protein [Spirochaetia bacterium]
MENNKLLYAIFTIGIVILVLLVVQMCIIIPMAMHSGHEHARPYPMVSSAPAQAPAALPGPCPMFKCGPGFEGHHHFHDKPMMPPKHPFPQPGQKGSDQKMANPQQAPNAAESQKPATPAPQTK